MFDKVVKVIEILLWIVSLVLFGIYSQNGRYQLSMTSGAIWMFDTRTGDLRIPNPEGTQTYTLGRLEGPWPKINPLDK